MFPIDFIGKLIDVSPEYDSIAGHHTLIVCFDSLEGVINEGKLVPPLARQVEEACATGLAMEGIVGVPGQNVGHFGYADFQQSEVKQLEQYGF